MHLRLGGARTNGAPGDEIGNELRRDDIKKLNACGHANFINLGQQLSATTQARVDIKTVVKMRVVNEPLPAHRGSRLLEIDTHDNFKVGRETLTLLKQAVGVLHGSLWIVNGARPNNDKQPVIHLVKDAVNGLA